jgi:hypothetical protein
VTPLVGRYLLGLHPAITLGNLLRCRNFAVGTSGGPGGLRKSGCHTRLRSKLCPRQHTPGTIRHIHSRTNDLIPGHSLVSCKMSLKKRFGMLGIDHPQPAGFILRSLTPRFSAPG